MRALVIYAFFLKVLSGRYKVRKEPSPAKRCEKMRKEPCFMEEKQTLLYHAYRAKF